MECQNLKSQQAMSETLNMFDKTFRSHGNGEKKELIGVMRIKFTVIGYTAVKTLCGHIDAEQQPGHAV